MFLWLANNSTIANFPFVTAYCKRDCLFLIGEFALFIFSCFAAAMILIFTFEENPYLLEKVGLFKTTVIFLIYFEELGELQAEIIQLWLNQEKYYGSKEQERIKWTVFRLDLSHRLEKAQLIKTLKGALDWLYNSLLDRSTEQKGDRKSWEGSFFWSKFRKFTKSCWR